MRTERYFYMEGKKEHHFVIEDSHNSPARPSGSSVKINMYEDVRMMAVVV